MTATLMKVIIVQHKHLMMKVKILTLEKKNNNKRKKKNIEEN
jgi:hypothetical protein